MNPGTLRNRVEVWHNVEVENKLKKKSTEPAKKLSLWAQIIPKTGSLLTGRTADTMLSKTTHVIKCRYIDGKDIGPDDWIVYQGQRYDIDYILNPYMRNETLEIFCQVVV